MSPASQMLLTRASPVTTHNPNRREVGGRQIRVASVAATEQAAWVISRVLLNLDEFLTRE